jgi:hypothetical protein
MSVDEATKKTNFPSAAMKHVVVAPGVCEFEDRSKE